MTKRLIKIGRWYLPIEGVSFYVCGDTVGIYPVGGTKLLTFRNDEQGKRLREWLQQQAEDLTIIVQEGEQA
jgi:hypothetical protein